VFTDTSTIAATWTVVPTAKIVSTPTKYGGGSGLFSSAGSYIYTPYVPSLHDWWTGDFTVEGWVNPSTLTGWYYVDGIVKPSMLGCTDRFGSGNYWSFGPIDTGIAFYYYNGSAHRVINSITIPLNTWTHIAMTHKNGYIYLFVNGVGIAPVAVVGTPQSSATFPLGIGETSNTTIAGNLDDIRITRAARYTADFTPPLAEFPNS
jgi:hypothetical protein